MTLEEWGVLGAYLQVGLALVAIGLAAYAFCSESRRVRDLEERANLQAVDDRCNHIRNIRSFQSPPDGLTWTFADVIAVRYGSDIYVRNGSLSDIVVTSLDPVPGPGQRPKLELKVLPPIGDGVTIGHFHTRKFQVVGDLDPDLAWAPSMKFTLDGRSAVQNPNGLLYRG
jgi:hypothetical protein